MEKLTGVDKLLGKPEPLFGEDGRQLRKIEIDEEGFSPEARAEMNAKKGFTDIDTESLEALQAWENA